MLDQDHYDYACTQSGEDDAKPRTEVKRPRCQPDDSQPLNGIDVPLRDLSDYDTLPDAGSSNTFSSVY